MDTMTLNSILSQMGTGTKQLTERFSEYAAPGHDQHVIYAYESPEPALSHGHEAISKYNYGGGGGHKSNAAMSALTLLAFIFFRNILQQCIKDHMVSMSTPQIMIMTAGREGEVALKKSEKLDKTGSIDEEANKDDKIIDDLSIDNRLTRINTANPSKFGGKRHESRVKSYGNRSLSFSGFVSAMD